MQDSRSQMWEWVWPFWGGWFIGVCAGGCGAVRCEWILQPCSLTCERVVFDDWIFSIALNGDFLATELMSRGHVVVTRCIEVVTTGRVGRYTVQSSATT
jgi:hypothetical protein